MTDVRAIVWSKPQEGMWIGTVRQEGSEYQTILSYRPRDEAWEVLGTVDGTVVHRSEHASREQAAIEAYLMLGRAIEIRERTIP